MARLSRIVIPDVPHHVTQRGNRRLPVFFSDDDRDAYLALLAEACSAVHTVQRIKYTVPGNLGAGIGGVTSRTVATNGGSAFAQGFSGAAASGIANAATRSAINGDSFGRNLIAALPDIIGQAVGYVIANEVYGKTQARQQEAAGGNPSEQYTATTGAMAEMEMILVTANPAQFGFGLQGSIYGLGSGAYRELLSGVKVLQDDDPDSVYIGSGSAAYSGQPFIPGRVRLNGFNDGLAQAIETGRWITQEHPFPQEAQIPGTVYLIDMCARVS